MVSPAAQRRAVQHLLAAGFSRTSSRAVPKERNPELKPKIVELAKANPRYGFRRIHALLEGVHLQAVHRIWKGEGLAIRPRKRRKLVAPKAEGPNLTGANPAGCLDFCHEKLENGRQARILAVLDCSTRECLLLKASSSFPAFAVERELERLCLVQGNGPEFRAMKLPEGIEKRFIQPGKPWQNGYVESFFGKLRDEPLSCELYARGADLPFALDDFQEHSNHHRPHLGLGGLTPANFRRGWQAKKPEDALLYC